MIIFRYDLRKSFQNKIVLICTFALPLALIFANPLWTGEVQIGFNLMAFVIMGSTFITAQGILNERIEGTLTRIMAAPVTMLNYLTQKLLAYSIPMAAQIIVVCLFGALLYDWNLSFTIALSLAYILFAVTSVAMAIAWCSLFKSKESSLTSFSLVLTAMAMLGGLMLPLDFLPVALRYIGAIFPSYWAANGIENLNAYSSVTSQYWLSIVMLIMFGIIFMLFGGKRRLI